MEEKSDIANAWAVLARSLRVTRLTLTQPISGSKVLRHLSQEVLPVTPTQEIEQKQCGEAYLGPS